MVEGGVGTPTGTTLVCICLFFEKEEKHDMIKRISLFALLFVVVVCTSIALAQDTVTVKLWMHDHPPRIPLDDEMLAQFQEENPGIVVEYTVVPDQEWDTTLATALASGAGPDLFNQATFAIGQFYNQGILVPVDAEAAGYADQAAIYDAYESGNALLAGATFDGTLYGLPTELSAYACYTNNVLWEAAGLDPVEDFPTTWEEMATVAEQLTVRDESGALVQRGFDFKYDNSLFMLLIFNPMVQQLGGNMIDEVNYTASIDTPEVRQVLGYWNDWVNTWKLGGPQYTSSRAAFLGGELAIDCDMGNWGAPQVEDAGIEYTIHPVPNWENKVNDNGFANYAYYFMVNSGASPEVQQAAWKLAGFLTSNPAEYLEVAGIFQAKADFVASEEFQSNPIMPVFLDALAASAYHPRFNGFFEVTDALMRMRDRVIVGGESMDTVLPEAQQEVSDILAASQGAS
jgi:multiple sugar transport system substrate-binding protein